LRLPRARHCDVAPIDRPRAVILDEVKKLPGAVELNPIIAHRSELGTGRHILSVEKRRLTQRAVVHLP
jgi:hypothetical protein